MPAAEAYGMLVRLGRIAINHPNLPEEKPEAFIHAAQYMERELIFTPIDDFFSLFPPIKRYCDDGSWDYASTNKMRKERFGTHFGKGDLPHLLMTGCYENRFVQRFGLALMMSIRVEHERRTGGDLIQEAFAKMKGEQGK